MGNKVSDFRLAESIIRKICKKHGSSFVDVPIDFDGANNNALKIGQCQNIAHTIFKIVGQYIDDSLKITGVQLMPDNNYKDEFLIVLASNLRSFMYGENNNGEDEAHALRLYQFPIVWILLKDIICPIYKKDLKNLKLIAAQSPENDIAKYYEQSDFPSKDISEEPFIFINTINNRAVQSAFIFIEALVAYGLSPIEIIKDIYETDLYDKFHGFLELSFDNDDEVNNFECTIMAALGVNFYGMISSKLAAINNPFMKFAQNSSAGLPNQFWYIGVLEKMIEPTRGSDWSVYQNLEPYIKEFWDKVEEVKNQRVKSGKDPGVPFDTLLRIKSNQTTGYVPDKTSTLQGLLSSYRVW